MWRILILAISALVGGCSQPSHQLHVLFENGDGIEKGDRVLSDDTPIGLVNAVSLTKDYEVLVTLDFQDSMPHKGSTFQIEHLNILGGRAIAMKPGRSIIPLKPGDTIRGTTPSAPKSETKTISSLLEKITLLLSQEENDSLLNEIEGLKAKVDSLERIRNNIDSTRQALPDSFPQSSGT